MSRPSANFCTWPRDEGVDGARLTATLLRSASSALVRMSRPSAIFSTWLATICRCRRGSRKLARSLARARVAAFASFSTCRYQRVHVGAVACQLVQVGFERALEDVAAFGELLDLAGDQTVDARAALGQLVEVVLQRLGEAARPTANFSTWLFEQAVDAGEVGFQRLGKGFAAAVEPLQLLGDHAFDDLPAFLELLDVGLEHLRRSNCGRRRISGPGSRPDCRCRQVGLQGARKDVAALGELLDLGGDDAVDAGPSLGELAEIGLQSARQDVAAFGQLADMPGDHFVNVHTGLTSFSESSVEAAGKALAACRQPFELAAERGVDAARCR